MNEESKWPHAFFYVGETKDLRAKSVYEGEIKELEESGEWQVTKGERKRGVQSS